MAEIWDVAAHVENQPDDYPQRWRLAKKLYAAHEYRLALEHLQILRNEWQPKMNVNRYLAATYYRLGRYNEAIDELEETIDRWPDEIGIREQLAYVFKADKHPEKALAAWEQVLKLQPEHTIAQKSVNKLRAIVAEGGTEQVAELHYEPVTDSAHDIPTPPPMPGMECTRCGAQNSEEFGDCWRCGKPLPHTSAANLLAAEFETPIPVRKETSNKVCAIAALGLLLCSLFLGIRLILNYNKGLPAITEFEQLYQHLLVPARITSGLAMLSFWPIVLPLTVRLLRVRPQPTVNQTFLGGLLLGAFALTALLLPVPPPVLVPALALLLFTSLAVTVLGLQISLVRGLFSAAAHSAIVVLLGVSVFWGMESYRSGRALNPVAEVAAIRQFRSTPEQLRGTLPVRLPSVLTPTRDKVRWRSSGSPWLDENAAEILITLRLEEQLPEMRFQIYKDGDLRMHEEIGEKRTETFTFSIAPDADYEFVVTGEDVVVQVLIQSLLPFENVE